MFQRSPRASARRAVAWPRTVVVSSLLALACSAPPGSGGDYDDGPDEFGGALPGTPGAAAPTNPGAAPTPGVTPTPSAPAPSAPPVANSGGGEQNPAAGAPIAPSTTPPPSNTGANAGTGVDGAGGSSMVPPDDGDQGAGGSSMTPPQQQPPANQQPDPTTPPVVTPPPAPTGPDIPCPADATFCSGFEGAGLPAGSVFQPTYLANEALTTQVELDSTVFHAGGQSLHLPAGANYYRMLAVPVPGRSFWVRLYTRSNVGFGADGSTHASLYLASTFTPDGDYNSDVAVEIAEQFDQILLNVKDVLFGTSGTNPNGQAGTTLPDNTWSCMETQFDGATGNVHVFVDGNEIIDATGWQPPSNFQSFRFGYLRFDSPTRDVWMDDVVVASSRIGCQ